MLKHIFVVSILLFSNSAFSQSDTPRAVVSIIVDGKDLNHVREVVGEAKALSRKVPIRNLLLIQKMPDMSAMAQDKNKASPEVQQRIQASVQDMQTGMELVHTLNLEKAEGKSELDLLEKLRITNSPTWIVRYKGRNYIYEGFPSIDKYFTAKGDFKEGD